MDKIRSSKNLYIWSKSKKKIAATLANAKTIKDPIRTSLLVGQVTLPSGTEMVMPGDDAKFNVKLITPIAMNEKLNFAIREGGKTVGAGVVTKIIK